MNPGNENLPAWLPQSVRSDPKKAGILAVLIVILGIATVRYFLMQGGPATANAATPVKQSKGKPGAKSASAVAEASPNLARKWIKEPITPLSRNLFAVKPEYYQFVEGAPTKPAAVSGFWDAIEKSLTQQADQKKRREILAENLQREAAKLRLQSTVMGPEPQAIIGGSLVKEGNVVASDASANGVQFRVLKIEPRRVILECEGIKLEIRMQK